MAQEMSCLHEKHSRRFSNCNVISESRRIVQPTSKCPQTNIENGVEMFGGQHTVHWTQEIVYAKFIWLDVMFPRFAYMNNWAASSEFGTNRLCEQRRFRRACASAQSRQNLRCSLIQAVNQEEPSDRKPDPWPLWMAGHAQLKCVMTECSKTQIRLTGLN